MNKKFICFEGFIDETEEIINKMIKNGYIIEIITQEIIEVRKGFTNQIVLFTSLWRWEEEPKNSRR